MVNFGYILVKNDNALVTFIYLISHLQLTIINSQIWLRISS